MIVLSDIIMARVERLMHRRIQTVIGGVFVAVAVFLEAAEFFKMLRELIPASLAGMISQLDIILIFFVGILVILIGKNQHSEGKDAASVSTRVKS